MDRQFSIAEGTVAVRLRGPHPDAPSCLTRRDARAAFLDRDGVINNNGWYVNTAEEFALLPGAAAAIRRLNDADIPVVVITNQGSVALKYLSRDELERIHDKMDRLLAEAGAHVDAVYAALAYPEGKIPELTLVSTYRKPETGMIVAASDELGLRPDGSFMVGDATTDILAGQRAGCTTILVKTGFGGSDGKAVVEPDHIAADLPAAVDLILAGLRG